MRQASGAAMALPTATLPIAVAERAAAQHPEPVDRGTAGDSNSRLVSDMETYVKR